MLRKKIILCCAVVAVIIGQTSENLSAPLWINRLGKCGDPFVTFLITNVWYFPMFFLSSLVFAAWEGQGAFSYLRGYSKQQHLAIFLTGMVDALNGALVIPASPSSRTPAIVASLIGCTTLLPMIIIKHFYFAVPSTSLYKQAYFVIVVVLYLCSSYTIVYPVFRNSSEINTQVEWWFIFFIGTILGNLYNLQQEKFFKQHNHARMSQFTAYLSWQTLYQAFWAFSLVWLDVIPGFGDADKNGLGCSMKHTFADSFRMPAVSYNIMFNVGYYIAYIGSCIVNRHDALIGVVAFSIISGLVTGVSYPIGELTPDKHVVEIGLVPLTIVLSTVSMVLYELWAKRSGVYEMKGMLEPLAKSFASTIDATEP
eukprot:c10220_g1_i1.p1 GENE.c10220_g1_i1~~c10220_g1_i1.p1  ORF type:complete len:368 (+),score=95.21 c10220_g1_i1:151-1254(+)